MFMYFLLLNKTWTEPCLRRLAAKGIASVEDILLTLLVDLVSTENNSITGSTVEAIPYAMLICVSWPNKKENIPRGSLSVFYFFVLKMQLLHIRNEKFPIPSLVLALFEKKSPLIGDLNWTKPSAVVKFSSSQFRTSFSGVINSKVVQHFEQKPSIPCSQYVSVLQRFREFIDKLFLFRQLRCLHLFSLGFPNCYETIPLYRFYPRLLKIGPVTLSLTREFKLPSIVSSIGPRANYPTFVREKNCPSPLVF